MKYIAIALLLLCSCAVPNYAQSTKKPAKAQPAKPATPDTRPVSATPVVEGDPDTKQDKRVVSANPVIEGDPMTPPTVAKDRITIEALKARLAKKSRVLILDVRSVSSWVSSPTKIKGAVRVREEDVKGQMSAWKKTQEIVTYCA